MYLSLLAANYVADRLEMIVGRTIRPRSDSLGLLDGFIAVRTRTKEAKWLKTLRPGYGPPIFVLDGYKTI